MRGEIIDFLDAMPSPDELRRFFQKPGLGILLGFLLIFGFPAAVYLILS